MMSDSAGNHDPDPALGVDSQLLLSYLSAMSHEIRTPLNAIIGFSGLLMESGVSRKDQENYSRLINRNSRRLLGIMSYLIDLARIETGKLVLFPARITVSRMVDDLRRESTEIQKALVKENIGVIYKIPGKGGDSFLVDWSRLFQILKILIENSLKFSEKGELVIDFKKGHPGNLTITVADQGSGMDDDTISRLFSLFPSAPMNEDNKIRSRGLGMLLIKKMCDLMNIGINVQSQLNAGTTFTLTIPPSP